MEKIYEENNNLQSRKSLNFSVLLSFVVALFAIISLVAVGFNQISYAAEGDSNITVHFGIFNNNPTELAGMTATAADTTSLYVPMMFSDSDNAETAANPIFCIQEGKEANANDSAYSKSDQTMSDNGLIYILNQSRVLGGPGITPANAVHPSGSPLYPGEALDNFEKKALETYATQLAIWVYMSEKYDSSDPRHGHLEDKMAAVNGTVNITSTKNPQVIIYAGNIYNDYVRSVVDAAKTATNHKTVKAVLSSDSITLVGDSDIYQTDKISVVATPSSDLLRYYVDLNGLDGAYLVDQNGNTKSSLDSFQPNESFYIRVPANKISDDNKTVKIYISGEFTNYVGGDYYVTSGDDQEIIAVNHENYRVWNEASIDFMVTPSTGMTTAQTIYFIGLIVLLCGVGIIYANAKPVEEK